MAKWTDKDRKFYKKLHKAQTSTVGMNLQLITIKGNLKKRLNNANTPSACDDGIMFCEKQSNMVQRAINGQSIKDKKTLNKQKSVFDDYKRKFESKKASLESSGQSASESFINFCDRMIIQ